MVSSLASKSAEGSGRGCDVPGPLRSCGLAAEALPVCAHTVVAASNRITAGDHAFRNARVNRIERVRSDFIVILLMPRPSRPTAAYPLSSHHREACQREACSAEANAIVMSFALRKTGRAVARVSMDRAAGDSPFAAPVSTPPKRWALARSGNDGATRDDHP